MIALVLRDLRRLTKADTKGRAMRDQTMIERSDPPMRREDLPVRQETATDFELEDTGEFTAPGDGGMGAAPA